MKTTSKIEDTALQMWDGEAVYREVFDLFVDRNTYQAPIVLSRVRDMVRNWDNHLCTPLVVSARANGTCAVIDGGHRLQAAQALELEKLPCWIYYGLSIAEEARLFVHLNTDRRIVNSYDNFRGMVAGDEDLYVNAMWVLNKHGFTIKGIDNPKGEESDYVKIECAAAILKIITTRNLSRLETILELLDACWPDDPKRHQGCIFRGLSWFLDRLWEANLSPYNKLGGIDKKLATKMSAWSLAKVLYKAGQLLPLSSGSAKAVGEAFRHVYNYKRHATRI